MRGSVAKETERDGGGKREREEGAVIAESYPNPR